MSYENHQSPVTNKLRTEQGFTLIELSIVIVIIGLIVAGVVGGQSLVRQSKLKSIMSDYNSYETALNIFKLEYNALPGDMINAHNYWPGCNSGATANECNGNGNGGIQWQGNVAGNESTRAWQHLNCRSCWIYFLTNLRAILAGGPDVRDFEHPNWNDSISIGFMPGGPVGEPRLRRE